MRQTEEMYVVINTKDKTSTMFLPYDRDLFAVVGEE